MNQSAVGYTRPLLATVLHHKLLYLAIAIPCFTALSFAILTVTPTFEATVLTAVGQREVAQEPGVSRKNQEEIATLASIAESEEVVRMAIERTGLDAFRPAPASIELPSFLKEVVRMATERTGLDAPRPASTSTELPLFLKIRAWLYPEHPAAREATSRLDLEAQRVMQRIRVRSQPLSDVIRISYRDPDPALAARFANALAQAFVDRQLQLFGQSGAEEFFAEQMKIFDTDLKHQFSEFQKFAKASGVYAIDDQRQLLLRRLDDLSSAANQTRASIADKQGQRQAISAQLRRLAPVARSPYVSSLVATFGDAANARDADTRSTDERSNDAPLLLVKAYQDSITALFRVNAELSGLERVEAEQNADLETLRRRLTALIDAEPAFEDRRRSIETAQRSKEAYEKRMIEERVSQQSRAAKLSSIKIFQSALVPRDPAFPIYPLALGVAFLVSAGLALGAVCLRDATGRRRLIS